MNKAEARKVFKEKRKKLSASDQSKLDDLLLIQFQRVELPFIHNVLSYWPSLHHNEPDTSLFSRYLEFKYPGLRIMYPKTDIATHNMEAIVWTEDTEIEESVFKTIEPIEGEIVPPPHIDMVFVPLLSFDRKGYRVGFGKGYYDRFLARCKKDCIKIGFSYFEPIDGIEDCDQFDVPLDLCITPQVVYVF